MPRNDRNRIEYEGWVLEQLTPVEFPRRFDCGNPDLNEFFTEDLAQHDHTLLTKTYALTPIGATVSEGCDPVALIAYCNDAIYQEVVEKRASKSFWKRFSRALPRGKRYDVFPAVKIARLGVQVDYQAQGVGTAMINLTKGLFLTNNRTGCRFLTVDAYVTPQAIGLYKKNDFQFFGTNDQGYCEAKLEEISLAQSVKVETIPMYYDLLRFSFGEDRVSSDRNHDPSIGSVVCSGDGSP